jgi:two-component system, chemotaxis family, CheB/CheR fusion protein
MPRKKDKKPQESAPDQAAVPIVAIGASAGGIEAFTELLKHLSPSTGLAFVYIQHLSPNHSSQLAPILARATKMTVLEATQLLRVQANHLYIIPPNQDMEVIDGVLTLTTRKSTPEIHMPIDQFFVSLAQRQKSGAIGILLSGMGSDGSLGLKAIKVAGGVTIAQDESAKFQSMPQSAVSGGVVDMVLSPQQMAEELERLSERASVFKETREAVEVQKESGQEEAISDEDLEKILAHLRTAVGVDFEHYKKSTIRRRIVRRMLLYKLETLHEYHQYLKQHPSEANVLYGDLLINVTSFFRDAETMNYLKKELLPQLIKGKSMGETIRIWIPACSTGQEAYSLAILLMEILGTRASTVSVQIFATDLSESAIAKARNGVYTKSELLDVSPRRLQRFFTKTDDHYRINKIIRDLCVFAPHNVLKDPPFSRIDLLSCRNLLIYLDQARQQKALATFHYSLRPDGYLILGKSEFITGSAAHFFQIEKNFKIFQRKNSAQSRIPFEVKPRWANSQKQEHSQAAGEHTDGVSNVDLEKLVNNLLLSRYVPVSVVVDQDLEIIQIRGSTGLFLEPSPGKPSFSLVKMARPALVLELRNIIHKARKTSQPTAKKGLEVKINDQSHFVDIEAVPIANPSNQQLFLVLFKEVDELSSVDLKAGNARDQRILELERELNGLREDMHSIIEEQEASNEELQAANEEIVSSNEELQSINEELETSKEEIESANEELLTINQELQATNDQLTEAYGYSEAILSTINEATLILDKQLRIKGANKAFYKTFRTVPEDIEGTMLYELNDRQWDFPGLRKMLEKVIANDELIRGFEASFDIAGNGTKIMLMHARKVVQHERQQAILLVLEDVTEHRSVQKLLRERQQWFEDLVDNVPALIWVSQADGKLSFLNKAWVDFTGQPITPGTDQFPSDKIHPDDREGYLAESTTKTRARLPYSVEYRLLRHDGQYRWVVENARPMFAAEGHFTGFIGTCTDVHLQKNLTQQLNNHVDQKTRELQQANQELEQANEVLSQTADRLQSVLNGVPAAITLMEAIRESDDAPVRDFSTSVFNQEALRLTGQTADEFRNLTLLEALPFVKDTGLFDLYLKVFESGESAYHELSDLSPDIQQTLAFLVTRQVDERGIVVTALDISERKQAELKLLETAESLQAVLNGSPASIGFFKAIPKDAVEASDFVLVVCNSKFVWNNAPLSEEPIGHRASELYEPEQVEVMKEVYTTRKPDYEEIFLPDEKRWLGVSISRHDHGVVIAQMDITLLKEAEQQQGALISQLEGTHEMMHSLSVMKQYIQDRGEFLRATSHDLRSSFGIIVGAATLLNIMDTDEERNRTLDMIQRNLRQVTQTMNQLLDLSRLEAGQEELKTARFNVAHILTDLCESSGSIAEKKNLWIRHEGPFDLEVEGDSVKVRRIAQNILINALKYTPDGGVTVTWGTATFPDQEQEAWQMTIADTGPGIPPRIRKRLSDTGRGNAPAQPTEESSLQEELQEFGGEGIGLFIVRHLCDLLQARLEVDSHPDRGTTFRIVFPVAYLKDNHS